MNKQTFIILCKTYKEYYKIHLQILNSLNLIDDEDMGAIITPIREALYRIIDNELSNFSDENRDCIIESIEDLIYSDGFYLEIDDESNNGRRSIYISSFDQLYDAMINNQLKFFS